MKELIYQQRVEFMKEKERILPRAEHHKYPGPADYVVNSDYLYKASSVWKA
jgi:hypothetical protein